MIVEVHTSVVCPAGQVFAINPEYDFGLGVGNPIVIRPPGLSNELTLGCLRLMALKPDAPDWLKTFFHATWIGPHLWVEPCPPRCHHHPGLL